MALLLIADLEFLANGQEQRCHRTTSHWLDGWLYLAEIMSGTLLFASVLLVHIGQHWKNSNTTLAHRRRSEQERGRRRQVWEAGE